VSPNSRRSKESASATSAAWAAGPRSPLIGKLFDEATLTNASNVGAIFSVFKPFEERDAQGLTTDVILASINKRLAAIDGAFVITILPPPINGIGNAGGFKMMLEDKKNLGPDALEAAAQELAAAANADPRLAGVFTPFASTTPNVYADIDRFRAAKLGVPPQRVFEALQIYLGSAYINDFNYLGGCSADTTQVFRVKFSTVAIGGPEIRVGEFVADTRRGSPADFHAFCEASDNVLAIPTK
jgi:multidrug efflux pump subunit AcrB